MFNIKPLIFLIFILSFPVLSSADKNLRFDAGAGYDNNYLNDPQKTGSYFYQTEFEGKYNFLKKNKDLLSSFFILGRYKDYNDFEDEIFIQSGIEIKKYFNDSYLGLDLNTGFFEDNNDLGNDYNSFSLLFFAGKTISVKSDLFTSFEYSKFLYKNPYEYGDNTWPETWSSGYHGGRSLLGNGNQSGQNGSGSNGESQTGSDNGTGDVVTEDLYQDKDNTDFYSGSIFFNHYLKKSLSLGAGAEFAFNHSNIEENIFYKKGINLYFDYFPINSILVNTDLGYSDFYYRELNENENLISIKLKTAYILNENKEIYIQALYDKLDADNKINNFESMVIKCGISFYL